MRKIILFMTISLDSFIGGPKGELDWEIREEAIGKYMISDLLKTVDTMLLGRELFEGFQQFWPAAARDPKNPKELIDFAHWVEDSPKIVVSKTLEKVEWKNSSIMRVTNDDELTQEIAKLKQSSGGDVVVFGGARMSQSLVRLGLIDEFRFKVQPIVLGNGLPLFKDLSDRIPLKLISSKIFDSGVVTLYYQHQSQKSA